MALGSEESCCGTRHSVSLGVASCHEVVNLVHVSFQSLVHVGFSLVVTKELAQTLALLV